MLRGFSGEWGNRGIPCDQGSHNGSAIVFFHAIGHSIGPTWFARHPRSKATYGAPSKSHVHIDPAWHEWIRRDLRDSRARWKIAAFHHPGFQSAATHWNDQRTRLLAPVLEEGGVDIVFAGHVHNYQRSKPLRFQPADPAPTNPGGPVRGTFQLDEAFDGDRRTSAEGIVYIVTGGGGAGLYPMGPKDAPATPAVDPDSAAPLIVKSMADRRSFSLIELDSKKLVLRQIDENGGEVDRITLSKPAR